MIDETNEDAELNTDALTGADDLAPAGNDGEGTDDNGSHGDEGESALSWAEALAGDTVAAMKKAKNEDADDPKKPSQKQETAKAKSNDPDAEDADNSDEEGSILPDDEENANADAGEDGETPEHLAKKAKALERDNYATREKNRKLRAELEAKEKRIAELESQPKQPAPLMGMPDGFDRARTIDDVQKIEDYWRQELEVAEDHIDTGWTGKDAQGEEIEMTPQEVRAYRRQVEKKLKGAESARKLISDKTERQTKAQEKVAKRYKFVTDSNSPRQALLKQLEKDHPEIGYAPDRDLLLGRLAVAKLIEDGEYEIVRKSKVQPQPPKKEVPQSPPPPAKPKPKVQAVVENGDWAMSLAKAAMPLG